jgi:hypothetical protein
MKLIGQLNTKLTDKPYLHRIELLDRFYKMLEKKELVFVRPSCWSDPMENIIFNATILKDGKPYDHPAKKNIYGQCWSYEGDSFALWQIYTTKPDDKGKTKRHLGIRITTHIDKLKQLSKSNSGKFYYGLVNYLWKKDLVKLPKDKEFIKGLKVTKLNEDHLKTLLVKRKSYSYENELRLLAVPDKSHIDKVNEILCRLKIEPLDFISSLRLDPAMKYADFKKHKEILVDKYGFTASKITHSTLERRNKFVFNLDDVK